MAVAAPLAEAPRRAGSPRGGPEAGGWWPPANSAGEKSGFLPHKTHLSHPAHSENPEGCWPGRGRAGGCSCRSGLAPAPPACPAEPVSGPLLRPAPPPDPSWGPRPRRYGPGAGSLFRSGSELKTPSPASGGWC